MPQTADPQSQWQRLKIIFLFQGGQEVFGLDEQRLKRGRPEHRGLEDPAREDPLRADHDGGAVRRRPGASPEELQRQVGRLQPDRDSNPGQHHLRELARHPRVPRGGALSGAGTLRGQPCLGGSGDAGQPQRHQVALHLVLPEHAGFEAGYRRHGRRDQVRVPASNSDLVHRIRSQSLAIFEKQL